MRYLENSHAGKLLNNEFMKPTNTDILTLSEKTDIPVNVLIAIIENKHDISDSIDAKLCKFFALSNGYFLRLQERYYYVKEKQKDNDKMLDKIE